MRAPLEGAKRRFIIPEPIADDAEAVPGIPGESGRDLRMIKRLLEGLPRAGKVMQARLELSFDAEREWIIRREAERGVNGLLRFIKSTAPFETKRRGDARVGIPRVEFDGAGGFRGGFVGFANREQLPRKRAPAFNMIRMRVDRAAREFNAFRQSAEPARRFREPAHRGRMVRMLDENLFVEALGRLPLARFLKGSRLANAGGRIAGQWAGSRFHGVVLPFAHRAARFRRFIRHRRIRRNRRPGRQRRIRPMRRSPGAARSRTR